MIEPWFGDLAEWKLARLVLLLSSPSRGAMAKVLTSSCIIFESGPSPPGPIPATLPSLTLLLKSGLGGPDPPLTAAG